MPNEYLLKLRCPACHAAISITEKPFAHIICGSCGKGYEVIDGAPILIDETKSLLSVIDIKESYAASVHAPEPGFKKRVFTKALRYLPHIPNAPAQMRALEIFLKWLKNNHSNPSILVLGSGNEDALGLSEIKRAATGGFLETDIYMRRGRMLVSDIHAIPLADESFDAVIVQGVLEHVICPEWAVAEIYRVLTPRGMVFSTTPWVMGVHLPVADFERFSRLEILKLFHRFDPLEIAVMEGPAIALAYSLSYFFMALFSSRGSLKGAKVAKYLSSLCFFWLRYIDEWTLNSPIAEHAAATFYYIGEKCNSVLADREIMEKFTGVGLCPW